MVRLKILADEVPLVNPGEGRRDAASETKEPQHDRPILPLIARQLHLTQASRASCGRVSDEYHRLFRSRRALATNWQSELNDGTAWLEVTV